MYGPEDIPGVGRFAVISNPGGAMFMLFRGSSNMPPRDAAAQYVGTGRMARVVCG